MDRTASPPLFRTADCIDVAHPRRAEVEAFVRQVYRQRYGAELGALYPQLLAFRGDDGRLLAAVGLRCGQQAPLFVERYLDEPAPALIQRLRGQRASAAEMVELGNFAAVDAGAARALILALIPLLRDAGMRWVLFVATRQLYNAFARLGLAVQPVMAADPTRLGDEAARWGSYYAAAPQLCVGDLRHAHEAAAAADPVPAAAPCLVAR